MSKRGAKASATPSQANSAGQRRMDPIEEEMHEAGSSASTPPRPPTMSSSDPQTAILRSPSNSNINRIDNKGIILSHSHGAPPTTPLNASKGLQLMLPGSSDLASTSSVGDMFLNMPFESEGNVEVLSPASYDFKKAKQVPNNFESAVHFLNQSSCDFFTVTKDDFRLYQMTYDAGEEPVVRLFKERKFRASPSESAEYTCRCVALDNTEMNRIAFGFNNGDIFVTSAYADVEPEPHWYNGHHIRMNHKCESLVHLAWDKTIQGKGYLCAAYEKGRGNDHVLCLFDVNQGQQRDLVVERQLSEKIYDMKFLNLELSTLLVSCAKNFRFIDIRERTGFMNITSVNLPSMNVAIEPYNNMQFAGTNGNQVTVYDRRFLSKPVFEMEVGPSECRIGHIEYNPNNYCNLSCSTPSTGVIYELDISPSVSFAHHLAEGKTMELMKQAVSNYAQKFSYGVKEINTSLKQVQKFAWCHSNADLLVAIPTRLPNEQQNADSDSEPDLLMYKPVVVDHNRSNACFPPDGSVLFSSNYSLEQIRPRPRVQVQRRKAVGFSDPDLPNEPDKANPEHPAESSVENRLRIGDIQRHVPFKGTARLWSTAETDTDLQTWFSRADINITSYGRALRGYGFGRTAGSARALIENSHKAVNDEKDESSCLKECWRLLIRVYINEASSRLQQKYGTLFPGVHRLTRSMKSTTMVKDDPVTFRNRYYLSRNRDDILRLCGWTSLEDHNGLASRLEKLMNSFNVDDRFRAATMAMFMLQGPACKSYLVKISDFLKSTEFTATHSPFMAQRYQYMVDLVLKALETYDGIRIQNYDELLNEVEQPYLMAMVRFIGRRQHTYLLMQREIMAISGMSVADRIAFAAIHTDDQAFREALKRMNNSVLKSDNPLAVLLISGLDDHKQSHIAIQTYLGQTNDIQTAALLLCAGNCFRRSKIWESYDMRKSVQERITIAITKNALKNTRKYSLQIVLQYMQWLQHSQLILQKSFIMTFLRKKLDFPRNDPEVKAKRAQPILPFINSDEVTAGQKALPPNGHKKSVPGPTQPTSRTTQSHPPPARTNGCPHADCSKPLPCCTICKRACNQQIDVHNISTHMEDWFIWCTKCCHGGHLRHLREWFDNYDLCPGGECDCECPKLDSVFKANISTRKRALDEPELLEGVRLRTLTGYLPSLDDEEEEEEQVRIIKKLALRDSTQTELKAKKTRRKSSAKPPETSDVGMGLARSMMPEVVQSGAVLKRPPPLHHGHQQESEDDGDTVKAESPGDDTSDRSKEQLRPKRWDKRSVSESVTDAPTDDTKPRSNSSLLEGRSWAVSRPLFGQQSLLATEARIECNLPSQRNVGSDFAVKPRLAMAEKAARNVRFCENIFILPQKQHMTGYSTSVQRNRLHQAMVSQAIYEQVEAEQQQLAAQRQRPARPAEVQELSEESGDDEEVREVERLVRFNQRVFNEGRDLFKTQRKKTQTGRNKFNSPKQVQRKTSEPSTLPSKIGPHVQIPENEFKPQSQSPNRRDRLHRY